MIHSNFAHGHLTLSMKYGPYEFQKIISLNTYNVESLTRLRDKFLILAEEIKIRGATNVTNGDHGRHTIKIYELFSEHNRSFSMITYMTDDEEGSEILRFESVSEKLRQHSEPHSHNIISLFTVRINDENRSQIVTAFVNVSDLLTKEARKIKPTAHHGTYTDVDRDLRSRVLIDDLSHQHVYQTPQRTSLVEEFPPAPQHVHQTPQQPQTPQYSMPHFVYQTPQRHQINNYPKFS